MRVTLNKNSELRARYFLNKCAFFIMRAFFIEIPKNVKKRENTKKTLKIRKKKKIEISGPILACAYPYAELVSLLPQGSHVRE